MSMSTIRFTVPGQPIGKGRPRATTRGGSARLYTPQRTRDYEGLIGMHGALAMAGRPPLVGPLAVVLDIRLQVPASWSRAKRADALAGRLLPTGKPDKDNVIKAIYDGLNGVCWVDDAQICEGVQRKRYADEPGVVVEIEEIG